MNDIDKKQTKSKIKSKYGADKIIFADDVPDYAFYFNKEKIDSDIFTNQFSSVHTEFNKDLVIVKKKNKYGIIHVSGQELLPVQYEKLTWISKDRIITCMKGKYGLSDTKGECLMPCIYDRIRPLPFVKQYGYNDDEVYRQYGEEVKLLVAEKSTEGSSIETGFNMNGQMIISPCLSINPGGYFTIIESFNEFPYICAEVYMNIILELYPRRYFFLDLKSIGFDYSRYFEECDDCIEYVCGKIIDDRE